MRIAVTGANGGLGSAILAACAERNPSWECIGFTRKEADMTDAEKAVTALAASNPEVIVHCAAMTGVDDCETHKELAWAVNVEGTRAVAAAAQKAGARLVYISTDYVFDGNKPSPYCEDDPPNPLSVYGHTKAEGERIAAGIPHSLIIRSSWMYGRRGKSFPATILRLAQRQKELTVVNDQAGAPTSSSDLAQALLSLIEIGVEGLFHVVNGGYCTWFELARAVLELKGIAGVTLKPITTAELDRPARRPANSRLNCARYEEFAGAPMRHWRDALADALPGMG